MGPNPGEAVGAILSGRYRLERLIGEGGLAAVYEAQDREKGLRCAIKLLHPQFVSNRAVVERFYAEARACFSLRHPHIAVVESYDYAEDGSPYMVMELLEGLSVEDYLKRYEPMTVAVAAPILYGVMQALSCAHGRGIVHRDLKPPNLFLVPQRSGQYTVKVLDFGIAKVMDVAGGMGSKTRTGAVLGTPGYMSPEQVKNAKAVDARTDLWSAAVVFYEMLTARHPFGSADNLARMVAVLRDPPTPVSQVAPHLASWDPFFARALARDPGQRFQSAEEMGEQLRAMAQGSQAVFVPEGLQTVSMPQMPDMTKTGALSAAPAVSASPATAATPAASAPSSTMASQARPQQTTESMAAVPPPSAPPAAQSHPPPAQVDSSAPPPHAGAASPYQPAGSTQVSGDRPAGTPTYHGQTPQVGIVEAADEEPLSLVWWAVVAIGVGCFALGVVLGYVLAS